ncbi:MAG: DNA repair exonuclease [Armatimonadota bacterium]|nr:DNA repair exonuclease [Armatimonadota bacterium]
MRILHMADVHLDAPYRFLGTGGEAQRQQVRNTFQRTCRLAVEDKYDLMLISGDLFDSNIVSESTADWVVSRLKDTAIPVCICPGTHDCLDSRSVYRDGRIKWPSNTRLFNDPDQQTLSLPELDITIHARPNTSTRSSESPIRGIRRAGATRWEVAMAHGSAVIPGKVENADFPIEPEEVKSTGLDYIALGHWHTWGDYSAGAVKAIYPGSLEKMEFGGGGGTVASLTLSPEGAAVEKREVGARRMEEAAISVAGMREVGDLPREILSLADPNLALRVTLTGLSDMSLQIDPAALETELAPGFFFLQILDSSHPLLKDIPDELFPERLVIGKYVRLMAERIEQARHDPESLSLLEDALRVGVAALQGRKVF